MISGLSLDLSSIEIETSTFQVTDDFSRTTSTIIMHGAGETGKGEDVIYDEAYHTTLKQHIDYLDLSGSYSFSGFSSRLGSVDLFDTPPDRPLFSNFRRWGFESAALDLALKQDGTDLGTALERAYNPVRFVVSPRMGSPPSTERIKELLNVHLDMEFKLDASSRWTQDFIDELADLDGVRVVDMKGLYEDEDVRGPDDPDLYRTIAETLPRALLEDPVLNSETRDVLEPYRDRVTWDKPITGLTSIKDLSWQPQWLNIKPSRFGTVESLFETIEYCLTTGINLYGGGQFELSVGRDHIHTLASLFYPDAPNDTSPREYHDQERTEGLPASPIPPPDSPTGLGGW